MEDGKFEKIVISQRRMEYMEKCVEQTEESQNLTISSISTFLAFMLAAFAFFYEFSPKEVRPVIYIGIISGFIGILLAVLYHIGRTEILRGIAQDAHDPRYVHGISEIQKKLERAYANYMRFEGCKWFAVISAVCFLLVICGFTFCPI